MRTALFETTKTGADFSECGRFRYALWRIWDESKPLVMFIGLNPSTANAETDDPTIRRVKSMAKGWGYGGVYMMNCFPLVSSDPEALKDWDNSPHDQYNTTKNIERLIEVSKLCSEIVFAWGNFPIVKEVSLDKWMSRRFPNAKALHINKNGSPKHPLYCRTDTQPILYSAKTPITPDESATNATRLSNETSTQL